MRADRPPGLASVSLLKDTSMSSTDFHDPDTPPPGSVPEWADVFDNPTTALDFVRVIVDVIEQRWGNSVTFDASIGQLRLSTGCIIDFANTACELIGYDEPYWRRYLFLMLSEYEAFDPAALDRELRSWTQIRSRLRVRLFPTTAPSPSEGNPWELVRRPISSSLSFILAADAAIGCVPVSAEVAEQWDRPIDQAWRTAIKNTRTRASFSLAAVHSPTARFVMLEGDLYTTGQARDLSDSLPGIVGPHGALVIAPTSRTLFVQPIDDPANVAVDAVGLIVAAVSYQSREPNTLTTDVLWYRGPNDLVGALDVGPGIRLRNVAPKPMADWLEPC